MATMPEFISFAALMRRVRWLAFFVCALSFVTGVGVGLISARLHPDPNYISPLAIVQARLAVDAEMRAACSNWFTDSRSAGLPAGRVVVCKAPKFLSIAK